ncbi:hypothetical protein D9C73_007335 [Collichthys lucidus]|uniref:Uncharacterized protein n=1 Tax=Collichthys lucidus TaxID=240159 RepID=A0A4U5UF83_COLLU|nr:hypothetical protein D9C73_007335 [Collichthys lucidus]
MLTIFHNAVWYMQPCKARITDFVSWLAVADLSLKRMRQEDTARGQDQKLFSSWFSAKFSAREKTIKPKNNEETLQLLPDKLRFYTARSVR